MSRFKNAELPSIVALDTFISNVDRAKGNIFYYEKNNRFFAIDFSESFRENLCELSCEQFKKNNIQFNKSELISLWIYCDMLKKLVKKYPPYNLHQKLDELVMQAGLGHDSPLFDDKVAKTIYIYKQKIIEGYASAKELISLLDQVFYYHKVGVKG